MRGNYHRVVSMVDQKNYLIYAIHGMIIWVDYFKLFNCNFRWVLTSLQILGRLHWIDSHKLIKFIFACQDEETGGFSDRPGNLVDPFHTVFGVTGLSLLAYEYRELHDMISDDKDDKMIDINNLKSRIKQVNPVFCLPQDIVNDIKVQLLSL